MSRRKNILYVGGFNFSKNNASSIRVVENAKFLEYLGHEVCILGKIDLDPSKDFTEIGGVRVGPIENNKEAVFSKNINGIINYINTNNKKVDIIIAYNYPAIPFSRLMRYCNKHDIELIPDLTEWYGIDGKLTLGKLYVFLLHEWRMCFLNRKCKNKIIATTYLAKAYPNSNNLLLPFVTTEKLENPVLNNLDISNIHLVYAGSPGKRFSKDRLDLILKAFHKLVQSGHNNFTFHIIGLDREMLLLEGMSEKEISLIEPKLRFYGRLPNTEAVEIIKECNFVIFSRDVKRNTNAGFPTKVFEAFKYGLPVVTNKTSDISMYVNEENGFLLDDASVDCFVEGIKILLESKEKCLVDKINNCRKYNPFQKHRFEDAVIDFFNKI
jgi:glycosyltransferase involved in cell wall biosynthesis